MHTNPLAGKGDLPNPVVFPFPDNNDPPRYLTISFAWDAATRHITGAVMTRRPGCQWRKVYIDRGADGKPDSTERVFDLGGFCGAAEFSQAELRHPKIRLVTVDDLRNVEQVTAGP